MKKFVIVCLMVSILLVSLPLAAEQRGLQVMTITTEEGEEVGLYEESHALIIGVSDYTAGWPDLPGVKKDVQAVKTALEENGFTVIVAEDPNRTELDQAFTDFINQYGQESDNRLLFYFSGHGHTLQLSYGDEMGYIVPVNAPNPNTDESGFISTALDMQMIEVYAKRIQSKHALFLFDSCFSGSIFSLSRAAPENITYKTAQPVRQFLTSGSAEEQVPDESIFRQQFIAALDGEGDVNGDGYVTGTELGEFLQDKVVNYSKGSQHPQYGKIRHATLDKGDFVFPLPGATPVAQEQETTSSETTSSAAQTTTQTTADPESEMWELIKNSDDITDVEDFLAAFPDGQFAKVAQLKLKQLEREQSQEEEEGFLANASRGNLEEALQAQGTGEQIEAAQELPRDVPDISEEPEPEPESPMLPDEDRPTPEEALMISYDCILGLFIELHHQVEARDADAFEEVAFAMGDEAIGDIAGLLDRLESSSDNARAFAILGNILSTLPPQMEEYVKFARSNNWRGLELRLERSIQMVERRMQDPYAPIEGAERLMASPPEPEPLPRHIREAILEVRNDILELRSDLQELAKKRSAKRFEKKATSSVKKILEKIEKTVELLETSPPHGHIRERMEALHEELPHRIDELIRAAHEGRWQDLQFDLERNEQEMVRMVEDGLQEPPREPVGQPLQPKKRRP